MRRRTQGANAVLAVVLGCLPPLAAEAAATGEKTGGEAAVSLSPISAWWYREAERLGEAPRLGDELVLEGPRNDWLVGAARIDATKPTDITLSLEGSDELTSAVDLKVAGEVAGPARDGRPTWWLDPLFSGPIALGDLSGKVHNWSAIRDFPRLHLQPDEPVMLWITVNTRRLPPGNFTGSITSTDARGGTAALLLKLTVNPVELPVDNPILGYGYERYLGDERFGRLALDYGINATGYYDDWDAARRWGFRYFKFNCPGTGLTSKSLDATDDQIREWIQPVKDTVARLHLRPEEWSIDLYDEPSDPTAWAYTAWAIRVRRVWPEAQIWANPGYNLPNNTSTVRGIVDPLRPYVTTWCPYECYIRDPEFLKAVKTTGAQVWFYTVEFRHARPKQGGRSIPWLAWRLGLDGWAFYNLASDDKDNSWGENTCSRMYPGHTVSLWLEGLRQGVQDIKRAYLLERRGMSHDQVLPIVLDAYGRKGDAPWGGAEDETYAAVRAALDRLLSKTGEQ